MHFHRVFISLTGETPRDYVTRRRLEKAVYLMEFDPARSLADIALATGFATPSVFSRSFRAHFKISPRVFRSVRSRRRAAILEKSKNRQVTRARIRYTDEHKDGCGRISVERFGALRVAFVRHTGNYDFRIGLAWARLMLWAKKHRLVGPTTGMISVSNDDPGLTPRGRLRYDACITVDETVTPQGRIGVRMFPAGTYAVFGFRGNARE